MAERKEQNEAMQQVEEDLGHVKKPAKVITVFSAKGGVGKTTIACELATFLSLTNHGKGKFRVCLVDYDLMFGDILSTLNFNPNQANMMDWIADLDKKHKAGQEWNAISYDAGQIERFLQKKEESGLYSLIAPITNFDYMKISNEEIVNLCGTMLRNIVENGDFDFVIVDTDRGLQVGKVVVSNIINKENVSDMKNVIRLATQKDLMIYNNNLKDAMEALNMAKKIAVKYNLNMNLIEANYTFERNQLLFFFLSDQRIDFREMARELASIYKTRIELRQIGVRDKAKEISGIGQCGRVLCCASYMKNFAESVSINMAKNQNLALNPSKINGQCGRLLCCLTYEDQVYTENRDGMPSIGDNVQTNKGRGNVVSINVLNRSYIVDVPNEGKVEVVLKSKCDECGKCNK